MKTGAEQITEERATHEAKGWTAEHDDQHTDLDMPPVAIHLLLDYVDSDHDWGLVEKTKREGGRIRQLVVAGALIAAEIDRLQRRGEALTHKKRVDGEPEKNNKAKV